MILVRITLNARPEKQKELRQTLISLMDASEKNSVYLSFNIFSDIEDMNVFNLITEFDTRKQLYQYLRSRKFTVLLGTHSLLTKPCSIKIMTISDSEGMETIDSVRKKMKSERSHLQ